MTKKLFAILLAAVMLLSTEAAFAAEQPLWRVLYSGDEMTVSEMVLEEKPAFDIICRCLFRETFANEGLAPVRRDGRWGFIDTSGNIVVPLELTGVLPFSEGLARVEREGFVSTSGNIAVPLEYDIIITIEEGLFFAIRDGLMVHLRIVPN
jgi:hypothetical protein